MSLRLASSMAARVLAFALAGTTVAAVEAETPGVAMDFDAIAVRILLGVGDREPRRWDGRVRLSAGEIRRIEGWRFRPADALLPPDRWTASSIQLTRPLQGQPRMSPTGVIVTLAAPAGAALEVETTHGQFRVPLDDAKPGVRLEYLDGQVQVDRVVPAIQITSGDTENDFPAAATAPDGTVWVAYVAHTHRGPADFQPYDKTPNDFESLISEGGGDQIMLMRFDGQSWSAPFPLTGTGETNFLLPGQDVWRPAIATGARGQVSVVWPQNLRKWELFGARFDPGYFDQPRNGAFMFRQYTMLQPGNQIAAALATDPTGRVWAVWQGWHDGQADIQFVRADDNRPPRRDADFRLTKTSTNEWSPTIAADSQGRLHVAHDTYEAGNYDVLLRTVADASGGRVSEPIAVAASARFEARPSVVCDAADRVWVAYEQRAADWGKDFGPLSPVQGSPLYMRGSAVQVRCVVDGKLMQPAGELMAKWPRDLQRFNSYPRLGIDGSGRLWLVFRHRHEAVWGANPTAMMVGGVWLEYATSFDGEQWSPPMLLGSSDNLLDVRPALARIGTGPGKGRLMAVYPSDGRLRREVIGAEHQRKIFFTGGGCTVSGQAKSDLFAAVLPDLGPSKEPKLVPADATKPGPAGPPPDVPAARGATPLDPDPEPKAIHPNFADDLQRIREYRIEAGGKKYQLLRGEFHRHTEWSMDGGEDGSLEDMWRYAIDAAALDWIGPGDHDLGGGREYPWWIIQKTTDIYNHPPRFVGMHTYERSVPYPNGHRNVMFDRRGIRTLPRLVGEDPGGVSPDDTKMLYAYLKHFGGICAVHTSGTGMGTDWRDNDPAAEPIVEIYQGDRNSYEALGGPRVARKQGEAIGGWRPLGMVWNAMALGHKFGFQSSSDHWSTHISYAIAIAEEPSRTAILDAFKKRHCYGATDNIILDVRMGEHLMGDEVMLKRNGPKPPTVTLTVQVHGTAPLARVDVIKDFSFVYATESSDPSIRFDWTDPDPRAGLSWYYVRVLQTDGQIAWGSPIWVQLAAASK
jgi:hypothetical protein